MSVEIHASIIEGVIGAAFVVIGIVLAEWGHRARDRRRTIEEDVLSATWLWPVVLVGMLEPDEHAPATETTMGSAWWQHRQDLLHALTRIRVNARPPLRRRRLIRKEADKLLAEMSAAEFDMGRGRRIPRAEVYDRLEHHLFSATFGEQRTLDDEIKARIRM